MIADRRNWPDSFLDSALGNLCIQTALFSQEKRNVNIQFTCNFMNDMNFIFHQFKIKLGFRKSKFKYGKSINGKK